MRVSTILKKDTFWKKCLPNIKNSLPIIYFNFEKNNKNTASKA